MPVTVQWRACDVKKQAVFDTEGQTFASLVAAVRRAAAPVLDKEEFIFTDFSRDICSDADVASLQADGPLVLLAISRASLKRPQRERISFSPHPKTLTHAGDYEYFAAQGHHPFASALAELVDNALRATRNNGSTGRRICVVLATDKTGQGLISVLDNGSGMTVPELNQWAVMNLSMEDRGLQPAAGNSDARGNAADRFLTSDLSFFGVGSKNAAFFMGKSIKIVTKPAASQYVHELCIVAAELEQRYKNSQAVYEEDILHRCPGSASTITPIEQPFAMVQDWVAAESEAEVGFTRVVVGQLKPDIMEQIADAEQAQQVCRDLAHIYHYYLHGQQGNRGAAQAAEGQGGLPDISVQYIADNQPVWQCQLVAVEDMETQYLKAQRAEMSFSLQVPGKGTVSGVLWYFPFENERETLPSESAAWAHLAASSMTLTQIPPTLTQLPGATQLGTQRPADAHLSADGDGSGDETDTSMWQRSKSPLFEAFWMGRLIPGARVDSLPFIEAVRSKRNAAGRDALPDEAFLRLRGALFFGPAFKVTRNKLTFRDNLPELLATAIPDDRNQDKRFREWLIRCHAQLDKTIRFHQLASAAVQARLRQGEGENLTAFERITDGSRTIGKGDLVKLAVKPVLIGQVLHFSIPKVVREDGGAHANGKVAVRPLPAEALQLVAGDSLPETSITLLNGAKQRIVRALIGGQKRSLVVVQNLWRLPDNAQGEGAGAGQEGAAAEGSKRNRKGKGKKGKTAPQKEDVDPNADPASPAPPGGELVLRVDNKTPVRDAFQFGRVLHGLQRAGRYLLEYVMQPALQTGPLTSQQLLHVSPGPVMAFTIQGEGRASNSLLLGEALPPLCIIFKDEYGNHIQAKEGLQLPAITLDLLPANGGEDAGGLAQLKVAATQEAEASGIKLTGLQITGAGPPTAQGLQIFAGPVHATPQSTPLAQQQQASQGGPAEASCSLLLAVQAGELGVCQMPLWLRAGPPHSLRLVPGHPWTAAQGAPEEQVCVASGDLLPAFQVQALDAWNNRTGVGHGLVGSVNVDCDALQPSSTVFPLDANGLASVEGLRAAALGASAGQPAPLHLRIQCSASSAAKEAAVEAGGPPGQLTYQVCVTPSCRPARLVLLRGGQPLPVKEVSEDGEVVVLAVLDGVQAGSSVSDLACCLLDEAGRFPISAGKRAKLQGTFFKSKTIKDLREGDIPLPTLEAETEVGLESKHCVRLSGEGYSLEIALEVGVVAGPPVMWGVARVDQLSQGSEEEMAGVQCGVPFTLEVEALDEYSNRCLGPASDLPVPLLEPEAEQPLSFDRSEWAQSWATQTVLTVKMAVGGAAGKMRVCVRDTNGPEGASLLRSDCIDLELRAGPATRLVLENPGSLECGTRALLSQLRVKAIDAWGNHVTGANFEVSLANSALAEAGGGSAASVAATGSNKAKLAKGVATFKNVRLVAEEAGTFVVRCGSASRKVALEDAVLPLQMRPGNLVLDLEVHAVSLGEEGLPAGQSMEFGVRVTTEDGLPLGEEVAREGLALRLMPLGGGKANAILLAPCRSQDSIFYFDTGELTNAGNHSVTAEYSELRAALVATLPKKQLSVRSSALAFAVVAGPPTELTLESQARPERLTATNGASPADRLLLKAVALQLRDAYGNVSPASGIPVRPQLQWDEESDAEARGCELPEIEGMNEEEDYSRATDERGRVFFGDLLVVEASGRAAGAGGEASSSLECDLVFAVRGLPSEHGHDPETWVIGWQCTVLFSDDAARFSALKQLNEQHNQLVQRRQRLQQKQAKLARALEEAQQQEADAGRTADSCHREIKGPVPETIEAAQALLAGIRSAPASTSASAGWEARYGPPGQGMTTAIDKCLQSGDADVVGVFAQLAAADDEDLTRVLSTAYRSMLSVLVVRTNDCRQRLTQQLAAKKLPTPDMLALTHTQPYRGSLRGEIPGVRACCERARGLMRAASHGSDALLPTALPHTRALGIKQDTSVRLLGATDWPLGCLGFAYNLVRPAVPGHRAALLANLLGQTLVFDTLDHAQAYREFMTQVLKAGTGDIFTLCGHKISGRGIIGGSGFKVPPLDELQHRFGSASNEADPTDIERQAAAVQALVSALEEQQLCAGRCQAAQQAVSEAEQRLGPELAQLDAEIDSLAAQLQGGPSQAGGPGKPHSKSGRKKASGNQRRKRTNSPTPPHLSSPESIPEDDEQPAAMHLRHKRTAARLEEGGSEEAPPRRQRQRK
ncbi:hypothetical protein WJX72_010046 [[Myrmecia] bisecta]|uniref:SMCHD1 ribosomal S5 domain-containing protein n=1 Tax=[Myrmecia] bisecta TaxID=41462 RepID=A0AAW1QG69_9CHLO